MKTLTILCGIIIILGLAACNTDSTAETVAAAKPTATPATAAPRPTPTAIPPTLAPTVAPTPSPAKTPPVTPAASAANADVLFVKAKQAADGSWRFDVTVAHPDTGWDNYADGWDVVLPDGSVVKVNPADPFTRLLLHPHETEQPFTRSQSGIRIPADVTTVTVRAHDLVDGWGGKTVTVDLTQASGDGFEVQK